MKALALIGLLLASPAISQPLPIHYDTQFVVGNDVDLNQGYYICNKEPGDLMDRIINISDDGRRRQIAGLNGCAFRLVESKPTGRTICNHSSNQSICFPEYQEGPIYKIKQVQATACYARSVHEQLTMTGTERYMICGREGHQLTVQRGVQILTVIWLSLDMDYE